METIIAENISRRYRNGRGIDGLSLSVRDGQCLGVLGANGSGKTTLTRLIAGLDRIQAGRLSVLSECGYPRPAHVRRRCGVALDAPAHWDSLSGLQNLWFFARQLGLRGQELARRVHSLLVEADLAAQADEPVGQYSFGMRRKLTIIEALCHDPQLLILDEPCAGLDTAFLGRLAQLIRRRCEQGKTTWVADNNADWLSKVATHVVLLQDARTIAQGVVQELLGSAEPRSRIEVVLERPGFDDAPNIPGVHTFVCRENHIVAEANGDPNLPAELLSWLTSHGAQVRSMEVRSMTLADTLARRAEVRETRA